MTHVVEEIEGLRARLVDTRDHRNLGFDGKVLDDVHDFVSGGRVETTRGFVEELQWIVRWRGYKVRVGRLPESSGQ